MKRVLLTLLFMVLPVLLVVWQVCFADTTSWYLVAAVLLLLSALPFFLHLERKPISAREMALLSVLTALAVVSRAVFHRRCQAHCRGGDRGRYVSWSLFRLYGGGAVRLFV